MVLKVDTILNKRYQILNIIAQGGMGAIYKAHDQNLNIQVAIKENLYLSEDSSRQFFREATILAGLRHPNLPRVTDHFTISNQGQYLAMDFVEGEDLRDRINSSGILSDKEVILIGAAICDALSYLHSRVPPIIHRDIKPGNVKISADGHIYLVDFGLAKIGLGVQTTIGAQSLTPGYAPPEQYGEGTDSRSDIYSLGATLYAALTSSVPEDGLARAMDAEKLTPIRKFNNGLSEKLEMAIEKAMAVKLADRYQNAEQFKLDLLDSHPETMSLSKDILDNTREAQGLSNLTQRVDSLLEHREIKQGKKKSLGLTIAILIGSAIICAALAGGGYYILENRRNEESTPTAINLAATPTIGVTQPAPAVEIEPTLIPRTEVPETAVPIETTLPEATPNGGGIGQVAFVSDRSGIPQIWLMNPDGSSLQQITKMVDGACQPAWSPDGSQMVITSPCRSKKDQYKGASLFLIKPDGSGLTPLPSAPGGDFDPAWSPDGSQIAFTSLRDGNYYSVYIYHFENKSTQKLFATNSNDRRPAWSPDGNQLVFETTRLDQQQLFITGKDGLNPKAFSSLSSAAFMPVWSPNGSVVVFSQGSDLSWLAAKLTIGDTPEFRISDARPALNATYSPDGYWLIFEGQVEGDIELFMMTSNGSNLNRVTNQKGNDFDPAWRP